MSDLTVKQLQQAWTDFHKTSIYQGQRFGQYLFNEYGFLIDDTYNIEDSHIVYNIAFNHITISLEEIK